MKRFIFLLLIILFLTGCGLWTTDNRQQTTVKNLQTTDYGQEFTDNRLQTTVNNNQQTLVNVERGQTEPPLTFNLKVPFSPQAPFANWDPLHNEACEEASMIMVAKYFKGEKLDKEIMEAEIQKLVKWEEEKGYSIDLTAKEVKEILDKYFGLKAYVSKEVTTDKIKKELGLGNLIIVPLAGREIPNPYYRQPGPLYHMLIIRGYDEDEFITNDPGTRRGEAYHYKYGDLLWAVHDWVGGVRVYNDPRPEPEMRKGEKVMVVVGSRN